MSEAQRYWSNHVDNYANGCIDPMLDDFLTNSEKLNLFLDICQQIVKKLESFGEKISKEFLNELCSYQKPFDVVEDNLTKHYLSYGVALIKLLNGEQENQTENS